MSDRAPLETKVAIVTGASSGIGRGIALALARAGACVVVGDVTAERRAGNFDARSDLSTVDAIAAEGGRACFQACDVRQAQDCQALAARAVAEFGGLDLLVNNAGVWRGGAFETLDGSDLEACWRVIALGSWLCAQAALPHFLAQGRGQILNIVSTAGLKGHVGQIPYNMAKAAQANLTRCLALEFGSRGVRANGICPTWLKTGMSRGGFESPGFDRLVRDTVPLGRWAEIADVAELAVYLASDAAAFLNGVLLPVDGGETLGLPVARPPGG